MKRYIKQILIPLLLIIVFQAGAQELNKGKLINLVDSLLLKGFENDLFPGASATLFINDTIVYFNKGFSKIEENVKITSKTNLQLGSVGKLLTAISVLQQVEKGMLNLEVDISEYVGDMELKFKFDDKPVTLHGLLTHSCGFNDVNIGYMVKNNDGILPLDQFIKQYNPDLFQTPETDIVYSNYSYALAGLIVQKVANTDFSSYVYKNIFEPLGMKNSTLEFPADYKTNKSYATTYSKSKNGFVESQIYPRHAIPAGSLVSTTEDMSLFIKALLTKEPNLLSESMWNHFYQQQFTSHDLLNGYAYGLEKQYINGKEAWAKGGMLPGTLSHILIVPNEFALFLNINTDYDEFGETFYKVLFDTFYPNIVKIRKQENGITTSKYVGSYRNKRYNRKTVENIIALFRGSFKIYENSTHDTLLAFHNGNWNSYIAIQNGVFQNVDLPYEYIVFKENSKGKVISMYRNVNIGGLTVQSSFEKTKWFNSPTFVNEYYAFIPFIIILGLILNISTLIIRFIRIWKPDMLTKHLLPLKFHILLFISITLVFVHVFIGPMYLVKNAQEFLLGYPNIFKMSFFIAYLLIPLTIGLGISIWSLWKGKVGNLFSRSFVSLIEIAIIIHLMYLTYWNFL